MPRVTGRALGTWSLRIDAAYCLILGVFVAAAAPQITTALALPVPLLIATGGIVAVWAGTVLWMVIRLTLRRALHLVMGANILAAALIAVTSLTAASTLAIVAVLAIALDVALFAISQLIAIRKLNAAPQAATA